MIRVVIFNELTGRTLTKSDCIDLQEAQTWVDYQISKPNSLA